MEVLKKEKSKPEMLEGERCKVNVKTYGNIWTRELNFVKRGDVKSGHKHEFDHLHFVAKGSVFVTVYDNNEKLNPILKKRYVAPAWIKVPKEHFHDIIALEDDSLSYCIQAILNEEGDVKGTNYRYDKDLMDEVKEFEERHNFPDETQMEK